jgi:iron(III) transport system substrate-binding protein
LLAPSRSNPGIPVRVIGSSTGSLLARVSAEGLASHWDIAWFEGDTAAAALDSAGLLARHTTPALDWTPLGRRLLPESGAYTPTGVTLASVFVYASERLKYRPARWDDLLALPAGTTICMNNASRSGPSYPLVAGMLRLKGGWPAGRSFLFDLHDAGLRICEPDAAMGLLDGEASVGLMASSSAVQFVMQHRGFAYAIPQPSFVLPSVIAIANNLTPQRQTWAEAFVRFTLSPVGQRLRLEGGSVDAFFWPVVNDAPPAPSALPDLSSLTVSAIDPYEWGKRQAPVLDWYNQVFLGQ